MTTDHDFIQECKRLAEAATNGPWRVNTRDSYEVVDVYSDQIMRVYYDEEREFVIHSRTAIPRLVEMVEERDKRIEELEEAAIALLEEGPTCDEDVLCCECDKTSQCKQYALDKIVQNRRP